MQRTIGSRICYGTLLQRSVCCSQVVELLNSLAPERIAHSLTDSLDTICGDALSSEAAVQGLGFIDKSVWAADDTMQTSDRL
jgi:hypothetical protein